MFFKFALVLSLIWSQCYGQFNFDSTNAADAGNQNEMLFSPFMQNSIENLDLFKTKIFKLIEAQNQYFEIIQQKRPNTGDYEYVKFDVSLPGHGYELPQLNNQNVLSIPVPNIQSNSSQLLATVDYGSKLSLWQFNSESSVKFVSSYQFQNKHGFKCVKLKSFVINSFYSKRSRFSFRFHSVALFRKADSPNYSDFLAFISYSAYLEGSNQNIVVVSDFSEEQIIKFERILDFDILYESPSKIYLALIQNSPDSNFKYELALYWWNGYKFDKLVSHMSDYILNANRVKLASLDGNLYLICAYKSKNYRDQVLNLNNQQESFAGLNFINVFQYIDNSDLGFGHDVDSRTSSKLAFVSSVNNHTSASAIYHMSGNSDFFFLLKKEDIDVYWWDGHSLIYYDTLLERKPLTFALHKLPEQPPLILSSDGVSLNLYYKEHSKFILHQIALSIQTGYSLEELQIFSFNQNYYIWLNFADIGDFKWSIRSYSQFIRVNSRQPESSDDIYNLDTCLADLRKRIESEIRTVKTLTRKSESLLVISPNKPYVEVDVIVNDTFRTDQVNTDIQLDVPVEQIVHGNSVLHYMKSIGGRLQTLADRVNKGVMLKSANQTVVSPVLFHHPISVNQFAIDSINSDFYLNDQNFNYYSNNCLTVNTEQVIQSRKFIFSNDLTVDYLFANQINGLDLKTAVLVQDNLATQFIYAQHHYQNAILLNGTTSPVINDVRLVEIFQDSPFPIQLLRNKKHFTNLTVNQLSVDTLLNGLDFKRFLSDIVWLDNPSLPFQELSGAQEWNIMNSIQADRLFISNKINDKIDINYFVNFTAKSVNSLNSSSPLVIQGPIFFNNYAYMSQNLSLSGLINGLNFLEDVILLHGDQDFTHKSGTQSFQMSAIFQNLSTSNINNLFSTNDFILKSRTIDLNGGHHFVARLTNKHFKNDLHVLSNVEMNDEVRLNGGIDLSTLFHQLDTFVSFNTPLQVDSIVIGKSGQMFASQLNQYPASFVLSRLSNIWLRDIPQKIMVPFSYLDKTISVDNLQFNKYRGGLKFPEHFVPKSNQTVQNEIIFGNKYFANTISANKIFLGTNGTVNGRKIQTLYQHMLRLGSEENPIHQLIKGVKHFKTLIIKGNLYINSGLINDNYIDQVVRIDKLSTYQKIIRHLSFESISIGTGHFSVKDLKINQNLQDYNLKHFWNEVVMSPNENNTSFIVLFNKHFSNGLYSNQILTNGTIGLVDLSDLFQRAMTLDTVQDVRSSIFFHNASFDNVGQFVSLNGLTPAYFKNVVLKTAPLVRIFGKKYFHNDIFVSDLKSGGLINRVHNLTHLVSHTLLRYSNHDQVVTAKHIFLKPIKFLNLYLPVKHTVINDVPFSNFVLLNSQHITISTDVVFENLYQINRLNVAGLINKCNLNNLVANSIKRKMDYTFDLPFLYQVPMLVVNGNIRLPSVLNQQANFIPQIMTTNDTRPLPGDIHFTNDVTVQYLYVNNLVNNRYNFTFLFRDAVYKHVPQGISGRKNFKRPLKIIGFIRQPVNAGRLWIGGFLNGVNVTDLFTTTVKTNWNFSAIQGNKFFTGKISFASVNLGQGINGLNVPNDLVLTHTDERLTSETRFNKRLHLHRNLNARLINRINLTEFTQNCVYLHLAPQHEIINSIKFVNPIRIHNLTVYKAINDIPVSELLHRNSFDSEISGRKTFRSDLHINGELTVNVINGLDMVRDIQQEIVDLRRGLPTDGDSSLSGSIIFDELVYADNMNIREKINNIHVKHVTSDHLKEMENYLVQSNHSIHQSIHNLNRTGRSLQSQFSTHHLTAIKYFKLNQILEKPLYNLYPIQSSGTNQQFTTFLIGAGLSDRMDGIHSESYHCNPYQNTFYSVNIDTGKLGETNLLSSWNQSKIVVVKSISQSDQFALIVSRSKKCDNQQKSLYEDGNLFENYIQIWTSTERFIFALSGQYSPVESEKFILLEKLASCLVDKAQMFTIGNSTYVLLHCRLSTNLLKVSIYKFLDGRLNELSASITPLSVNDVDLVYLNSKFSYPTVLMALAISDTNVTMPYNPSKVSIWNSKTERFDIPLLSNYGEKSYLTRFVETPDKKLFVIFATSNSIGSTCSYNNIDLPLDPSKHSLMIYYLVLNDNPYMKFSQRILIGTQAIRQIETVNVGTMTYLIVLSSDSLSFYQLQGYNGFQLISQTKPSLQMNSISTYWTSHNRLFLAINSNDNYQSQILSAVLSGSGQSARNETNHSVQREYSTYLEAI